MKRTGEKPSRAAGQPAKGGIPRNILTVTLVLFCIATALIELISSILQ